MRSSLGSSAACIHLSPEGCLTATIEENLHWDRPHKQGAIFTLSKMKIPAVLLTTPAIVNKAATLMRNACQEDTSLT